MQHVNKVVLIICNHCTSRRFVGPAKHQLLHGFLQVKNSALKVRKLHTVDEMILQWIYRRTWNSSISQEFAIHECSWKIHDGSSPIHNLESSTQKETTYPH